MFSHFSAWRWGSVFSLIGIFLALYILWERIFQPAIQPCNVNSTINCTAIISGSVSTTLGIPTALFGLTGFLILLLASVFQRGCIFLVTAILGLLFCLWIAYQEIFLLHVVCPVCILCQLTMIASVVVGVFLQKKK